MNAAQEHVTRERPSFDPAPRLSHKFELERLQQEIASKDEDLQRKSTELRRKDETLVSLQGALTSLEDRNAELEARVTDLQTRLRDVEFEQSGSAGQPDNAALTAENEDLRARLAQAEQTAAAATQRIEAAAQSAEALVHTLRGEGYTIEPAPARRRATRKTDATEAGGEEDRWGRRKIDLGNGRYRYTPPRTIEGAVDMPWDEFEALLVARYGERGFLPAFHAETGIARETMMHYRFNVGTVPASYVSVFMQIKDQPAPIRKKDFDTAAKRAPAEPKFSNTVMADAAMLLLEDPKADYEAVAATLRTRHGEAIEAEDIAALHQEIRNQKRAEVRQRFKNLTAPEGTEPIPMNALVARVQAWSGVPNGWGRAFMKATGLDYAHLDVWKKLGHVPAKFVPFVEKALVAEPPDGLVARFKLTKAAKAKIDEMLDLHPLPTLSEVSEAAQALCDLPVTEATIANYVARKGVVLATA